VVTDDRFVPMELMLRQPSLYRARPFSANLALAVQRIA
jgi:hypothetical protein